MSFKRNHLYAMLFRREDCISYSLFLAGSSAHDNTLFHCTPRTDITGWHYSVSERVSLKHLPWPIVLIFQLANLDEFEKVPGLTARLLDRMIEEDGECDFSAAPTGRTFDGRPWFMSAIRALETRCLLSVDSCDSLGKEFAQASQAAIAAYSQGRGFTFVVSRFSR